VLETPGRLLRLLGLFQARPEWSAPELAERLRVTERTVRRDVTRLRDLGYPVEARPGVAGGYRFVSGAAMPPLLLDDEEVLAVAVGLRSAADGTVAGLDEAAERALGKLERVMPARLRPRMAGVGESTVTLGPGGPQVERAVLPILGTACALHERVRFTYVRRDGSQGERVVEPYRVVLAGRRWYLVGRDVRAARDDPDADPWRSYRLDRVSGLVRTGEPFRPPADPPDAAAFVARGVSTAAYRWRMRAEVDAPADVVAARVPPTVGIVEALDAGRCVLVTGSDSLESLALHVGLLGAGVRVLEPEELRPVLRDLSARLSAAAG
jgi:predicted DNA-binding transcriptional regulator YafY